MKKVLVGLLIALFVGVAGLAGPTISLGGAYFSNQFDFGVGVGMQSRDTFGAFGVEADFIISDVYINPDPLSIPDPSTFAGFAKLNLTYRIPGAETGPQWYALLGIGTPMVFAWHTDIVTTIGMNIGTVFGIACESLSGHGASILGYWDRGYFGVGLVGYIDLFGFKTVTE